MSKPTRFALVLLLASFLASCATPPATRTSSSGAFNFRRMSKVRTTAYTHTEAGGRKNAVGKRLCGDHVISAAADWSRFPLGTKFRIIDTNEVFQIDDYGSALVGTDTIDLYKTNRLAMRKWGARRVDIDILQWGSAQQSLVVLAPRARNRNVRRMIVALQEKARTQNTIRNF